MVFQASRGTSVTNHMLTSLEKDQSRQRQSLIKQLAALQYLLRQGLSVRNDHSGGSNLSVLLEGVLDEQLWIKESKYESPEIINE